MASTEISYYIIHSNTVQTPTLGDKFSVEEKLQTSDYLFVEIYQLSSLYQWTGNRIMSSDQDDEHD